MTVTLCEVKKQTRRRLAYQRLFLLG
jgi:hypothetical protein